MYDPLTGNPRQTRKLLGAMGFPTWSVGSGLPDDTETAQCYIDSTTGIIWWKIQTDYIVISRPSGPLNFDNELQAFLVPT
jgi:hypothetical protein